MNANEFSQQEQQLHFEKLVDKMRQTLLKKGNDYSQSDRLFNFKSAGYITGGSSALSCLNLIAIKITRLTSLLQSGKLPDNESIKDTTLDLCCYAILLDMIIEHESPEKQK